ncbi:MAG: lipid-A-disaccharide synthase [Flavobacteriaceae bacterium]|nr:lipid-A-disaccharide synthase [Flavobacteriaceae bacterium]|tara:strand:- start:3101 stop:4207 length:1107 start_codon:yes stop_codon:yes gene_type:complete
MKYYIIAGEASGDLHGASLIKEIKLLDKQADFRCWGGNLMNKEGAYIVKHYRDISFMGFWEVFKNMTSIINNLKFCKRDIKIYNPHYIIYIDYPGFNLRIAKWAKKKGFKNHYYISPQVWAWKENRVSTIRHSVDKLYVILPFEKIFFDKNHKYSVDYVGHPLLEQIPKWKKDLNFLKNNHLSKRKKIIALMPGSRKQEINKILPEFIKAKLEFPEFQFVIAGSPGRSKSDYNFISKKIKVPIIFGKTYDLLQYSHAALVASGTATLEAALFGVPQIVCYKSNFLNYIIAKFIVKLKFISLVNLIMDKEIVKELIQNKCNSKNIVLYLKRLLSNSEIKNVKNNYKKLNKLLDKGGASKIVANLILKES